MMALALAVSEQDKIKQHLDKLSELLWSLRRQTESPHDTSAASIETIENALFEILQAFRLLLGTIQ